MNIFLKRFKKIHQFAWPVLLMVLLGTFFGPEIILCKGLDNHVAIELRENKCCTTKYNAAPSSIETKGSFLKVKECLDTPIEPPYLGNRQLSDDYLKFHMSLPHMNYLLLWEKYVFLKAFFFENQDLSEAISIDQSHKKLTTTVLLI